MKQLWSRCLLLLVVTAMLLAMLTGVGFAATNSAFTQTLDSYSATGGSFTLAENARIFVPTEAAPSGNLKSTLELVSSQFAASGYPTGGAMSIAYGHEATAVSGDIIVKQDSSLAEEGYRIEVTQANIYVYYCLGSTSIYYNNDYSYNGLLYGFNTLLKYFITSGSKTVDCCTISDAPDTKERTLQLDIARKYWTVDWIKNLIREASWMGYNTLDLHMTEDQGYRANIWRDRSGNTVLDCNGNDFAWTMGANYVTWNEDYQDTTGGIYTREDLVEIIECAKQYHIEIIPAVDFPTHADALIAKFKSNFVDTGNSFSFTFDGTPYSGHSSIASNNGTKYSTQTLNVVDDYARNLSFALTQAYADFFGEYGCTKFNIGADEVAHAFDNWATASYTASHGGKNAKDAYVIFINELAGVLQRKAYGSDNHNYRVRAFNDALFGNGFYKYGSYSPWAITATVEVNKDIDVLFWTAKTSHTSPSELASQGRTVYNCINWYTYYVLRVDTTNNTGEARDDNCTQWTFNHSSPQRIYSGCGKSCSYGSACNGLGWNPSRFWGCDSSCYRETVTNNLGGAYFLIWGDWAGYDTQTNIWGRNDDKNLIRRMWSNSIKQWNWDVEDSLSFDNFVSYRDSVNYFPGYTDCDSAVFLPSAGKLVSSVDRSALEELLSHVLPEADYTEASYSAYASAIDGGRAVNENAASTQAQVDAAVAAIRAAANALELRPASASIELVFDYNGAEKLITTIDAGVEYDESYLIELPLLKGYRYSYVEGGQYMKTPFGSSSGYVIATATSTNNYVKVHYTNEPYLGLLRVALEVLTEDKGYANYSAYQEKLASAQAFYDRVSVSPETLTYQAEVNAVIRELLQARISLAMSSETTTLTCGITTDYVAAGHVAVLYAETTPDVTDITLTLDGYDVSRLSIAGRENIDGSKSWRVRFLVPETAGNYSYVVTATALDRNVTETLAIEVK